MNINSLFWGDTWPEPFCKWKRYNARSNIVVNKEGITGSNSKDRKKESLLLIFSGGVQPN